MRVWISPFPLSLQEKQTKEALTRKQQKCRRKNQDEESQEAPELLKRPKEYTVRFTFPNPPPLSPPVLGLHGEHLQPPATQDRSMGTPVVHSAWDQFLFKAWNIVAGTFGVTEKEKKLVLFLTSRCDIWL